MVPRPKSPKFPRSSSRPSSRPAEHAALRADGLEQFDFTITKQFRFTEARALQFRAEFFNLTNSPTFATPATTIDTVSGGQVASTLNASRTIELALKLFF